jgi:hypothetical protein
MDENPFKRALEPQADAGTSARLRPFEPPARAGSLPKRAQLRTIEELRLVDPGTLAKNPRVAKLTVRDLNDLAAQVQGVPTSNGNIADLTIEDMQDIEGIFLEYKMNTARELASSGLAAASSVDVSCCCCTPCCCCAAADTEPVLS